MVIFNRSVIPPTVFILLNMFFSSLGIEANMTECYRGGRLWSALLLLWLASVVLALPQNQSSKSTLVDAQSRFMIVGDSITHGADGDHTWRYRLWQWCQ